MPQLNNDNVSVSMAVEKYYLYPGFIFANKTPHIVDTILGSCVSVYLRDSALKFSSINHFMLPCWDGRGKPSHKYGDVSTSELIQRMVTMGSSIKNLEAKIFGGSELNGPNGIFNIGLRNCLVAEDVLKNKKIPILSFSLGGHMGRKVIFYSDSGAVLIKFIRKTKVTVPEQHL